MSYRYFSLGPNTRECIECLSATVPSSTKLPIALIGDEDSSLWEEGDYPSNTVRIKLKTEGEQIVNDRRFPNQGLEDLHVVGETSASVAATMGIRCGSTGQPLLQFDGKCLRTLPVRLR